MLAIGLDPSRIKELEIKEENRREGDPVSMDKLIRMKDGMKLRQTQGYDKLLIWALAGANKESELQKNVKQLNKILKFLNSKGIGYKMMSHLITANCNYRIGMPKPNGGIPFRFIRSRNIQDRALEQEIRLVRKKFQQYAYQLKMTDTIKDIVIPAVKRVDKPETVYPPYRTDIGGVYASRPTNSNNNNNRTRRTIIYNDGAILPERIEDLSPQQSPTGSIQGQGTYEVLATGEHRKVTTTSNSMIVEIIREPRRYIEMASRRGRNNQNTDQDIDIQTDQQHTLTPRRRARRTNTQDDETDDIRDFDDSEEEDEKTPSWMNRYIRNQNRNMNTLTNLLNDRLGRTDEDDETNRQTTRKREFDKYIEKLRIEHDLKTKFTYRLGKGRMTDVEAQILQVE